MAQNRYSFLLVHGAWMGAFAWNKVRPILEAAGHSAQAVELPSHGDDDTPASEATLDAYRDTVLRAAGDGKPVLVGHSMAGMVISAAAEAAPDRFRCVVYVAAYLPRDGESLYGISQTDADSLVGRYWRQDDPAHYSPATIAAEGIISVFGEDCGIQDQQTLLDRHRPEPLAPLAAPVTLTTGNFGRVRKSYIATSQDRCVSPALQLRMLAAYPDMPVRTLATGHCPFFSQPEALARTLMELAG